MRLRSVPVDHPPFSPPVGMGWDGWTARGLWGNQRWLGPPTFPERRDAREGRAIGLDMADLLPSRATPLSWDSVDGIADELEPKILG